MFEFFTKPRYRRIPVTSYAYTTPDQSIAESADVGLDLEAEDEKAQEVAAQQTAVGRIHKVLANSRGVIRRFIRPENRTIDSIVENYQFKPQEKVRSLYTQLLHKVQDDPLLAKDYLSVLSRATRIDSSDLRKLLGYFADIGSLGSYNPRYERGYGVLGFKPKVTKRQIDHLAGILADSQVSFLRDSSETGTYYTERLKLEKETLGDKATSLYKEALSSKVVSQVGFSRLVKEFGEKHALAIAQMASKYSSADELVRLESEKRMEYATRNPNSRILGEYNKIIKFFEDSTKQETIPVRKQKSYIGRALNKVGTWTGLF